MLILIAMAKRGFYRILFILAVLLLIIGVYTVIRLSSLGAFRKIEDQTGLIQKVIAKVPGPEALQLDGESGVLFFISNQPCSEQNFRGGIYFLKLNNSGEAAHPFEMEEPEDFHPHGLSFFRDKQGERLLFTNNHRESGTHTVEIFEIVGDKQLKHLETIKSPSLTSPNDLVAIGARQFYVTNDGRSHDRTTRSVDTFLGRKTGNVLYYDGKDFNLLVDNLHFPNGIAFNHSTNELIVGETMSGNLVIYRLEDNDKIVNVDNFFVGTGIDNIYLEQSGDIIAAVHPNMLALSKHMKDVDNLSPSQVFRVKYQTIGLKLLYQHDGSVIAGVSAAVSYKNHLYVGAVCDDKLVQLTSN